MSENQNTPQSFDVVLGGNNLPKSKSSQKKVENPKLKNIINAENINQDSSSKTNEKVSSNQSKTSTPNYVLECEDFSVNPPKASTSFFYQLFVGLEWLFLKIIDICKWLFYIAMLFGCFHDPEVGFFESIWILNVLCLFFGLIHPRLSITLGSPISRWTIAILYLPFCIIGSLLFSSNP